MVLRKILFVSAIGMGLFALGCGNAKQADESAGQNAAEQAHAGHDHAGHDHAGHDHSGHDHAAHGHAGHDHAAHGDEAAQKGELVPQKTCPVMGEAVNKNLYVEHEGKRIYVCCEPCKAKVKENPEKFIEKLKEMGEKPISM
jgi:YHS domain-containing protein